LPHVISVAGARRVGKSTLIKQLINHLISEEKIQPKSIFFMNLEHPYLVQYSQDVTYLQKIFEDYLKVATPEGLIYCFLDEVQFFVNWPVFIKAHYEQKKVKFVITGSNSSLLSDDLITLLSGRSLPLEVLPFSFEELAREHSLITDIDRGAQNKHKLRNLMDTYLRYGGFPEVACAPSNNTSFDILSSYTKAVLYQDVAPRLQLKKPMDLERLFVYLMSTIGTPFSYNSLSKIFDLSDKTIKDYITAFTDSYLMFPIDQFSYSLKQQIRSLKKCYAIDTGQVNAIAFKFSENYGRLLENVIYLELRRRNFEVFTHKTENDLEVDFITKKNNELLPIQVTQTLQAESTRKREVQALITTLKELSLKQGIIVTVDEEEEIMHEGYSIHVIPAYKFLINH
jgi:predicted AAA+ superfamily ATPase